MTFGLDMAEDQVCVDVQVFEDRLVEVNETISLFAASNDSAILLLNMEVEILIVNTDSKYSFNYNFQVDCLQSFYIVAMFSFDQMLSTFNINELSGEASVCVELAGDVELGRDIILELAILTDGTADSNDIDSTTLTYAFSSGSRSGDVLCNRIGITVDGIVENTEEFSIELTANPSSEDVLITQSSSIISIDNSPSDRRLP